VIRALLCLALFGACSGETGLLSVTLTTAPGSTLLDSVQTLRMTLTNPRQVFTAERMGGRFELAFELEGNGEAAALHLEGFDANGALVANGESPHFPVGALTGRIVIYMAPPLSVGAAPLSLAPARTNVAIAALPYGALLAGGTLDTGAPSDAVTIYNAYDHSLVAGVPMPAPRSDLTLVVGGANIAYMFGGNDEAGVPTANLWRFDTTTPPAGSFVDFGIEEGFARAGQTAVPIGNEEFLITGSPVGEMHGIDGSITVRTEVSTLPAGGVSLTANDGMATAIFAGPEGVVRFRSGTFTTLPIVSAARADAEVVVLPGGKVGVVCGTTEAVRIDAASGSADAITGVPSVEKSGCAAAATTRHLIIAGGTTSAGVDGNVEIFDAATLALLTTVPLVVPRTNAVAIALPNDQILIAGGTDAAGAPVGTFELFTPPVE
jgi:hypothetical protein